MVKKRKGQGLSFNVIVIAVIALVVLVVIIAIFVQQSGKSIKSFESCFTRGGDCKLASAGCDASTETRMQDVSCPEENDIRQICCVKLS